ncbi:hypothetical protein FACS1894166_04590 [Bacilli bacterium]|nr:hypothetical protein FACS1894166_04590 [Bacilli bacterium]
MNDNRIKFDMNNIVSRATKESAQKFTTVSSKIKDSEYKLLKILAKQNGCTVSSLVNQCVDAFITQYFRPDMINVYAKNDGVTKEDIKN